MDQESGRMSWGEGTMASVRAFGTVFFLGKSFVCWMPSRPFQKQHSWEPAGCRRGVPAAPTTSDVFSVDTRSRRPLPPRLARPHLHKRGAQGARVKGRARGSAGNLCRLGNENEENDKTDHRSKAGHTSLRFSPPFLQGLGVGAGSDHWGISSRRPLRLSRLLDMASEGRGDVSESKVASQVLRIHRE